MQTFNGFDSTLASPNFSSRENMLPSIEELVSDTKTSHIRKSNRSFSETNACNFNQVSTSEAIPFKDPITGNTIIQTQLLQVFNHFFKKLWTHLIINYNFYFSSVIGWPTIFSRCLRHNIWTRVNLWRNKANLSLGFMRKPD